MSANNVTPSRIFAATLYSLVTASLCAEAVAASVSAKAAIHEATRANEANVFLASISCVPRPRILRRCSAFGQLHPRKSFANRRSRTTDNRLQFAPLAAHADEISEKYSVGLKRSSRWSKQGSAADPPWFTAVQQRRIVQKSRPIACEDFPTLWSVEL